MEKPIVAITMGDPTGIGPEVVIKALSQGQARQLCRPFLVADPEVMRRTCRMLGADVRLHPISDPKEAVFEWPALDVLQPEGVQVGDVPLGRVSPVAGKAAILCLRKAFEMALAGQVHGVVSAPLNKEAFHLAGFRFADELQYLADLTGSPAPYMFGLANGVWTVAVAEHVAFADILKLIKKENVLARIRWMHGALQQAGLDRPRLAVSALNVHAGEGGLLGREEIDEIGPAIQQARAEGIDAHGPFPADTIFPRALAREFDGVVFMHHDQANIARKLQPREKGGTIFMGLPVPCGTTAHGTAFDIAGKGIADPGSLEMALEHTARLAARLADENAKG